MRTLQYPQMLGMTENRKDDKNGVSVVPDITGWTETKILYGLTYVNPVLGSTRLFLHSGSNTNGMSCTNGMY